MAKNQVIYFTKDVRFKPTVFNSEDGTNAKKIFDPSTEGSRVMAVIVSSTSDTSKTAIIQINNGTDVAKLGHINIPAGAGTNGAVAVVSGLNRGNLPWLNIDSDGNPFVDMNFGMNLELKLTEALSAGETIDITVQGANYDAE